MWPGLKMVLMSWLVLGGGFPEPKDFIFPDEMWT